MTVGHGARPAEDLLGELRDAGVGRLVDVRTAPGSKRHPQFGQRELAAAIEANGMEYVWRKDLGGWRKPRTDSPHVAIRNPSFRGYADHMDTAEFADATAWLIRTSRDAPTAVMCAETLWWRCHRRMIADALQIRGVPVAHLVGGAVQPHRLHPAARVDGGRLVYDAGAQQELAT